MSFKKYKINHEFNANDDSGVYFSYLRLIERENHTSGAQSLQSYSGASDPLLYQQRYIYNSGLYSAYDLDLNVLPAWKYYDGTGVNVAVIDQGIDRYHEDLFRNTNFFKAYDAEIDVADYNYGSPIAISDNHGTAVAGIIAAEKNNIGITGIAYKATLIPIYDPLDLSGIEYRMPNSFVYAAHNSDVINNSWGFGNLLYYNRGFTFWDNFLFDPYIEAGAAISYAAEMGRDALGSVIVFSAGNARAYGDNTNLHSFQASRYVISVASANFSGEISSFSTPGASLLVTAFGQQYSVAQPITIATTDRIGTAGYDSGNYVGAFSGTSAAAPMVSAVAALMLQANPSLGWRDVQEILAFSARHAGLTSGQWLTNGAQSWNGGGLRVNHDYGFGLVDAAAAVRLAETWQEKKTTTNEIYATNLILPYVPIPDANNNGVAIPINISSDISIEHVELHLQMLHQKIGDIRVLLESPSGMSVVLVDRPGGGFSIVQNMNFILSSTFFWEERSAGTWNLRVIDAASGNTGSVVSAELTVYGSAITRDNTYYYSDDYAALVASDASRGALIDSDGGRETLNFAAFSGTANLNLTSGGMLGSASLTISNLTLVKNALAGAGNDSITGNNRDNLIVGGWGDDWLGGGRGHDTMVGGQGNDNLRGDEGNDSIIGSSGSDYLNGFLGLDTIFGDDASNDPLGGNDTIFGGDNRDTIFGGGGADYIVSGVDHDLVYGGYGNDYITAKAGMFSSGADTIIGGADSDTIILQDIGWWSNLVRFEDIVHQGQISGADFITGFQSDWIDSSGWFQEYKGQVYQGPAYNPADILDVSGLLDDLGYARNLEIRQQAIAVQFSGTQLDGFNLFNLFVDTDHNGSAETLIAQIQNVTDFNPAIGTIDFDENFIWL